MGCTESHDSTFKKMEEHTMRSRLNSIDNRKKSTRVVDAIIERVTILSETLTPKQTEFAAKKLSRHELFNSLTIDELKIVCREMAYASAPSSEYLFQQGDAGHSFFIIETGRVDVEVDNKVVAHLEDG